MNRNKNLFVLGKNNRIAQNKDVSMIAIDTITVENEPACNMYQRPR